MDSAWLRYIKFPSEAIGRLNLVVLLYQNLRRGGVYVGVVRRVGFEIESFDWMFTYNVSGERWLNYTCALYEALSQNYKYKYVGVYFYNDNKINVSFIRELLSRKKVFFEAFGKLFSNFYLYDYTVQCFRFINEKVPSVIVDGESYLYGRRSLKVCYKNRNIDKAIEKLYNVSMEEGLEYVSRTFINNYFREILKRLTGLPKEIRKKRSFLVTFADTLSFKVALYKSKVTYDELNNWLNSDDNFRKIFEWIKLNKKEVVEFILFSKAGFYGEKLKNKFNHINENILVKLLNIYFAYENSSRHQKFIGRESEPTGKVLGGEDPNPSIFVEEKE